MTRGERKLATALRRVIDALDDYASERMFDGEEESRSSAAKVDREIAKARAVLRAAEGFLPPARALPPSDIHDEGTR